MLVNMELVKNPANWIIVWSMVAFGLIALALVNQVHVNPLETGKA